MAELRDDIEKYLTGQMSPAEMHAMEKRALSDPFLADALEGESSVSVADRMTDLNELGTLLTERQKRRINWMIPLRIAAAVGLLAAVSYGVYRFALPSTNDEDLALKKSVQQETSITDSVQSESLLKEELKTPAPSPIPTGKVKKQPELVAPLAGSGETAQTASGGIAESKDQSADNPVTVDPPKEQPTTIDALASQTDVAEKSVSDSHIVLKGKVTEAGSGSPLSGVNVTASGTSNGAVSDSNGDYQVVLDSKPTSLVFSSLGYQTKEVHIPAAESKLNVEMPEEASQLNEVVVVGYSKNNNEALSDEPIQLARPVDGRRAYDNYLESNLRYPPVAYERKIEGRVTVQFTVQVDGSLSDFVVVHGLEGGCNEEVIRLVKDGPAWKPSTQANVALKSTMRVRVKFRL